MRGWDELRRELLRIDRKGYGAYKDIRGAWGDERMSLHVDRVQGDPFATPSVIQLHIAQREHAIPHELWRDEPPSSTKGRPSSQPSSQRRVALQDLLLRRFAWAVSELPRVDGSGKSGRIHVDDGGAEILLRSGCHLDEHALQLRFRVGLPARGRSVLGRAAAELLCRHLPDAADELRWDALDPDTVRNWLELADDHAHLQRQLVDSELIAFIRDGSILPRRTGVSAEPLPDAVPFRSPETMRVTLPTRHHGDVTGMGIPDGVTLVTGGGFHGKTTLLEAIQHGIHPHIPGDGREWVVTRPDAVKVRSEDGRAVTGVDLSPFIRDLPRDRDTQRFTTTDASGSTSLAAAIVESLQAGSRLLLLDEDTCATNLLVRDARMQELVQRETIVPFVDRVRELSREHGVSTLLVLGGSGDYLDVADHVVLLEDYLPSDATQRAHTIAEQRPTGRATAPEQSPIHIAPRFPDPHSFDPRRGRNRKRKVKSRGLRELLFGEETIDLSGLEQLVDDSQARAIGVLLQQLRSIDDDESLRQAAQRIVDDASRRGLYELDPLPEAAMPRALELIGAVNRLRSLRLAR